MILEALLFTIGLAWRKSVPASLTSIKYTIPIYKCAVLNVHVHYVMCIPKVFMNCTICTHTFITRTYIQVHRYA